MGFQVCMSENRLLKEHIEIAKWACAGSYTVEAAVVMPLVIVVILAVFTLGFYRYNRIMVYSACAEQTLCAVQAEDQWESELKKRLIGAHAFWMSVDLQGEQKKAEAAFSMRVPYWRQTLSYSCEVSAQAETAPDYVRRIRRAARVWEETVHGGD